MPEYELKTETPNFFFTGKFGRLQLVRTRSYSVPRTAPRAEVRARPRTSTPFGTGEALPDFPGPLHVVRK